MKKKRNLDRSVYFFIYYGILFTGRTKPGECMGFPAVLYACRQNTWQFCQTVLPELKAAQCGPKEGVNI